MKRLVRTLKITEHWKVLIQKEHVNVITKNWLTTHLHNTYKPCYTFLIRLYFMPCQSDHNGFSQEKEETIFISVSTPDIVTQVLNNGLIFTIWGWNLSEYIWNKNQGILKRQTCKFAFLQKFVMPDFSMFLYLVNFIKGYSNFKSSLFFVGYSQRLSKVSDRLPSHFKYFLKLNNELFLPTLFKTYPP